MKVLRKCLENYFSKHVSRLSSPTALRHGCPPPPGSKVKRQHMRGLWGATLPVTQITLKNYFSQHAPRLSALPALHLQPSTATRPRGHLRGVLRGPSYLWPNTLKELSHFLNTAAFTFRISDGGKPRVPTLYTLGKP